MMRVLSSEGYTRSLRRRARLARRMRGTRPTVHYFHQVDDPYSHLAVQKLEALRAAYDLAFETHLVSKPAPEYQGNPERFTNWAIRDAQSVAEAYGTSLRVSAAPNEAEITSANGVVAPHLGAPDFTKVAFEVGEALWAGAPLPGGAPAGAGAFAIEQGNALRAKLRHYFGGMFHFEGEWFWGIDRIRTLERRLIDEGFAEHDAAVLVPQPRAVDTTGLAASDVTLEYFPSLRSPYTAVGHRRVLDLIERSGVRVELRPVMPMMMRGVPAPFPKQHYVVTDAAREARAHGVAYGRMVDPFGEPVKRAFALFPAAVAEGRGMEFVSAYLSAAWAEGIDIGTDAGLRRVCERAGLAWQPLLDDAREMDWEALLDANLGAMLDAGLWGVPSFRVSGGKRSEAFACWGQDRIWRVENEIAARA